MDTSNDSPSVAALPSRPLWIRTPRAPVIGADHDHSVAPEEPVTPNARNMEPLYIVVTMGLGSPVNLPVFTAGIADICARYPRFQKVQVKDGWKDGNPRWARVALNVEDHIIVPTLDAVAVEADPEQAVEDYVASLSTLPMDLSRPPWEFHFLDFPTPEATSTLVIRLHHSIGDGMSLIMLLLASSRSDADPTRLPAMPKQPARSGAVYQRAPCASGALAFLAWAWSYFVLAWNTAVDGAFFLATIMGFLRDPQSVFRREDDGGTLHPSRRFVRRSLSLDDVKFIKNAMNCTVNDVLVGLTSAALSRYHFRNSGDTNTEKICVRSVLPVNLRPAAGLQTYVRDVVWGNKLGYILLPFNLAMHDDQMAYVRNAKKTMDRKKSSLEVVLTFKTGEFFLKKFGPKAAAFIASGFLGNTTMTLSTMVGPTEKILFCGHPVVFLAPSVYGIPQALIVHYQSYNNNMELILSVDDEVFPDYNNNLLDDFSESLRDIKDAASRLSTSTKKK